MNTAIIELDPLADPVRPTTENYYFVGLRRVRFALFFISGVQVRRVTRELGRTGIDSLKNRS